MEMQESLKTTRPGAVEWKRTINETLFIQHQGVTMIQNPDIMRGRAAVRVVE